jgi:hypothetical protein
MTWDSSGRKLSSAKGSTMSMLASASEACSPDDEDGHVASSSGDPD